VNFNQLFRGIDVVIGTGTPGATGVQLPGAQGSSIQDATITVGSGYAGIEGGAGAGGSHEMVTVIGGKVGMDYTKSLNCPTITGATLIGQTVSAIVYDGLEAASVVGTTIKPAPGALALAVSSGPKSLWGKVSIIDTSIDYDSPPTTATVQTSQARVVTCGAYNSPIQSNRSLYLRNVYIRGCKDLVVDPAATAGTIPLQVKPKRQHSVFSSTKGRRT
jgi:hypothetical protein